MKNQRVFWFLSAAGVIVALVGCELAVDFDRSKIPVEAIDGGDTDTGSADATTPVDSGSPTDSGVTDSATVQDTGAPDTGTVTDSGATDASDASDDDASD